MTHWSFHNPVRIVSGNDWAKLLSDYVLDHGCQSILLVTYPGSMGMEGYVDEIKSLFGSKSLSIYDDVELNPSFESCQRALDFCEQLQADVVVALGGGSVLDTAKVIVAGKATDTYLMEDIVAQKTSPARKVMFVAIPTTHGTGSEVTSWATLWDKKKKVKHSLSMPILYPDVAILSPTLTTSLPLRTSIVSGLDALSHALESIWNKNHNPVSDGLALKAISLICTHLPLLKDGLTNLDLRASLCQASLLSGLAFSNTKTAMAHAISYPLTTHFGLPHGLACSISLPQLLKHNSMSAFNRVKIVAKALDVEADTDRMVEKMALLFESLGISVHLTDYGISKADVPLVVRSALGAVRAGNNIVDFDEESLTNLVGNLL